MIYMRFVFLNTCICDLCCTVLPLSNSRISKSWPHAFSAVWGISLSLRANLWYSVSFSSAWDSSKITQIDQINTKTEYKLILSVHKWWKADCLKEKSVQTQFRNAWFTFSFNLARAISSFHLCCSAFSRDSLRLEMVCWSSLFSLLILSTSAGVNFWFCKSTCSSFLSCFRLSRWLTKTRTKWSRCETSSFSLVRVKKMRLHAGTHSQHLTFAKPKTISWNILTRHPTQPVTTQPLLHI